jgi:DNA-binding NarL/FixJ family response regulator
MMRGMPAPELVPSRPRVALGNDFPIVIEGLRAMFSPFADRIELVGGITMPEAQQTSTSPVGPVDVLLYDTFGRTGMEQPAIRELLALEGVHHVAVFTFSFHPDAVEEALQAGATGFLSKSLPAPDLVTCIERIAHGEKVVSEAGPNRPPPSARDWPARIKGLSEREAETAVLAAGGLSNPEIAEALFLSVDTIKTHLRHVYRKLGVRNRTELAVRLHEDDTLHARRNDPAG